jgi:hypothetical protein
MAEITWGEIYAEFCNWNTQIGAKVIDYRPWGSTSIVVWLNNGQAYKVKRHASDRFTMQIVTQDDIDKKFGTNK